MTDFSIDFRNIQVYVDGVLYKVGDGVEVSNSEWDEYGNFEGAMKAWTDALVNSGITAQYLGMVVDLGMGGFGSGAKATAKRMVRNTKVITKVIWNGANTGLDLDATDVIEFKYSI